MFFLVLGMGNLLKMAKKKFRINLLGIHISDIAEILCLYQWKTRDALANPGLQDQDFQVDLEF